MDTALLQRVQLALLGTRMHALICAADILNVLQRKYMQILLFMFTIKFFLGIGYDVIPSFRIFLENYELLTHSLLGTFYVLQGRNMVM